MQTPYSLDVFLIQVPFGWSRPPPDQKENGGAKTPPLASNPLCHALLLILYKDGSGYRMAVSNTGEGLGYHVSVDQCAGMNVSGNAHFRLNLLPPSFFQPCRAHPSSSGDFVTALSFEFTDVKSERVESAPFWWALLRFVLHPHLGNGPAAVYEHILPAVNEKLLAANFSDEVCLRSVLWPERILPQGSCAS